MRSIPYRLLCIIIASITLLVYLPALNNGFVNYDDNVLIYNNPSIRSIDIDLLTMIFSPETNATGMPLNLFSYAVDYAIWGLNPFGFHLTNIIIHTINTILVFILTLRLVESGMLKNPSSPPFAKGGSLTTPPLKKGDTGGFIPNFQLLAAGITALLFGIHPLNAEPINWLIGRSDLLSAFFFLLTVISYFKYIVNGRKASYGASLFFFAAAMLSKPTAASLPAVLLIMDFYIFKRLTLKEGIRKLKVILMEKIPFFLLSFFFVALTAWFRQSLEIVVPLKDFPLILRILITVRSFIFYLYKMLFPFSLSPYYPYPMEIDLFSVDYAGAFILLLLITVFCIKTHKKNGLYLTVWLYYLSVLSPMALPLLGLYKIGLYAEADRYAYIALIGPFFLLGLGAAKAMENSLYRRLKTAYITIICIICIFLVVKTVRQTAIWHDAITLWDHEIKLFPKTALPYNFRGFAYYSEGKYKMATSDYSKAIELNPEYAEAYNNRASSYLSSGNFQAAISDYDTLIKLNPEFAPGYYNRGAANYGMGSYKEAIMDYARAIELNPRFADAYNNRAAAYYAIEKYREALQDYDKAVELNPGDAAAKNNRETVIKMLRKAPI